MTAVEGAQFRSRKRRSPPRVGSEDAGQDFSVGGQPPVVELRSQRDPVDTEWVVGPLMLRSSLPQKRRSWRRVPGGTPLGSSGSVKSVARADREVFLLQQTSGRRWLLPALLVS